MAFIPSTKGEPTLRAIQAIAFIPSIILIIVVLATSSRSYSFNGWGIGLIPPTCISLCASIAFFAHHRKQIKIPGALKPNPKGDMLITCILLHPLVDALAFGLYIAFIIPFVVREVARLLHWQAASPPLVAEIFFLPSIFINMQIHAYYALYHFIGMAVKILKARYADECGDECPNCGHSARRATRNLGGQAYSALGDRGYRDEEETAATGGNAPASGNGDSQNVGVVRDITEDVDVDAVPRESLDTQVGEDTRLLKV